MESQKSTSGDNLQGSIKVRMPRLHDFREDVQELIKGQSYVDNNSFDTKTCSTCGHITIPELKSLDKDDEYLCYDCATEVLANITVKDAVNNAVRNELNLRKCQTNINKKVTFSDILTSLNEMKSNEIKGSKISSSQQSDSNCDIENRNCEKRQIKASTEENIRTTRVIHELQKTDEIILKNRSDIPVQIAKDISYEYIKGEILGSGKFGKVFKIVHKVSGRLAAAKEIRYNGKESKEEICKEIEILKYLSGNEYILELYEVVDCCQARIKTMILITEYLDGGDLFNQIANEDLLTETQVIHIMTQILEGVLFMHNNAIIHRDLKPENIMYRSNKVTKIKIIDFGFAVRFDESNPPKSMVGTTIFVAPEVLSYENQYYQTDIWSVGVIAYNLLTGITPFEIPRSGELDRQLTDMEIIANIQRCQYDFEDEGFIDVSEEAKDFITLILIRQPRKRLTAEQCLKHSWIDTPKELKYDLGRSLTIQRMKSYVALRKWEKLRTVIQSLSNFKTALPSP